MRMGEIWYKVEERGHKIGTDTMCCFYLSTTETPTRAEQLKKRLAAMADAISWQRTQERDRRTRSFGARSEMAEEPVLLAHARLRGPLIVVEEIRGLAGTTYQAMR